MNRTDHAKKQLRVMQELDEDHTLTQLANAWVDLVLVGTHTSLLEEMAWVATLAINSRVSFSPGTWISEEPLVLFK
jgi:hypothetical protein